VSLTGLVGSGTGVSGRVGGRIVYRGLGGGGGCLAVKVGDAVRVSRGSLRAVGVSLEGFRVSIRAVQGLRLVRDNLHASRNRTSRSTSARSIGGGGRSTITLGKLLHEGVGDVVGRDVNGVGDTSHNQGTLGRERKGRAGRVETGAGRVLDLTNTRASLADDRSDQDVRDQQSQRVGLGLRRRCLVERLVVKRADDEAESLQTRLLDPSNHLISRGGGCTNLCHSIDGSTDGQDTLSCSTLVIRHGALRFRHLADLRHVLTSLSDDCGSFSRSNQRTDVDPLTLVNRRLQRSLLLLLLLLLLALGGVRHVGVDVVLLVVCSSKTISLICWLSLDGSRGRLLLFAVC
jgi:hypothetical protein